jgi:hypothetical protein
LRRGYQPRNNFVKDENGDMLADSHNISNRWKNYYSQLLNVYNVSDVRQIKIHTAETSAPGPSRLKVAIAIAKLNKYKLYQFTKRVIKLTNNYCGISLLSTSHKILSNNLLSRLSPYIGEIFVGLSVWVST